MEHCAWTEGSGKSRRSYSNSRSTYKEEFIAASFGGSGLNVGNYTYPFAFVLPNAMSGSFELRDNIFVKYPLSAYLASFDGKNDNQFFTMNLNVREPLKVPYGPTSAQRSANG